MLNQFSAAVTAVARKLHFGLCTPTPLAIFQCGLGHKLSQNLAVCFSNEWTTKFAHLSQDTQSYKVERHKQLR